MLPVLISFSLQFRKYLQGLGQLDTMKALAKKEGVTKHYISHLIKLAWLSPSIMQAIFRGKIAATLSLNTLKKGFPLDWHEQWQTLGFADYSIKP